MKEVHKVNFQNEPIWLKMNVPGRYNGMKFRFNFKEYYNEELETLIRDFKFTWPGRIPEDKAFAEKGIKELFIRKMDAGNFTFRVKDETEVMAPVIDMTTGQLLDELETDSIDDIVQEGQ